MEKKTYYHQLEPILKLLKNTNISYLSDLNINIIKTISNALNIDTCKFVLSSELNKSGSRSEKLLEIIRELNCDTYLSPLGSKEYIESDSILNKSEIKVVYQDFMPKEYEQKNIITHISLLSIIDVIANIGLYDCNYFIRG